MNNHKKTILHIITDLDIGGAEKQLLLMLPYLQKNFHNHVVCMESKAIIGKKIAKINIPVTYINSNSYINPFAIWRLYKTIKKIKPDIAIGYLLYADIVGRITAKLAGVKTYISSQRSSLIGREYLRWYDKTTKAFVTHYTVQTKYFVNLLSQNYKIKPNKFTVIPNAVNINHSPKTAPTDLPQNNNTNIICISNLKSGKGHKYLLEAFEKTYGQYKNINLLIIGSGHLKKELSNQIKDYQSKENIFFLGKKTSILSYLHASHIFVLPTEGEGMSNALLEAMSTGLACITSDIPANKEVIIDKKDGLLFENKDTKDLSKKMRYLIANEQSCHQIGLNAKQKMTQHYNPSSISKKWINLINTL